MLVQCENKLRRGFRRIETRQMMLVTDLPVHGGRDISIEGRGHPAWQNGVDPYVMPPHFGGQRLCQAHQPGFGRAIGCLTGRP